MQAAVRIAVWVMTNSTEEPPPAWQPLTGRGMAAFAGATLVRLLAVQFAFAALAAGAVVWFLQTAWFPVVTEAIRQLPPQGEIRSGTLDWRGESPVPLAEGPFLGLVVDLDHEGSRRSPAHLQAEFGRADCRIISLLGFRPVAYPAKVKLAFNRTDLEPLWGAWRPMLLGITAGAVIGGLMLTWFVLASVYALPVYLTGLFANRNLSLAGSWRLAGAALMPGALLMILAILLYGAGVLDLVGLGLAVGAHWLLQWGCLVAAVLSTPRHPLASKGSENPFAPESPRPPV